MKNLKNKLFTLTFILFAISTHAQLKIKEPVNNCAEKSSNSEVDVCDLSKPQGNACLCDYYKRLAKHRKKMSDYRDKRYSIDREIRSLGKREEVNIGRLRALSEEEGFYEAKRKYLSNLSKNESLAERALALSREKSGYCEHYNCADADLRIWQDALDRIRRDRIEIQNTEPEKTVILDVNNSLTNKSKESQTSSNSFAQSASNGLATVQAMRDKANSIQVKRQYDLDYKNDLLKLADELERNLIKPEDVAVVIGSGVDSNTNFSNNTSTKKSYTNTRKYQAYQDLVGASSELLVYLLQGNPENAAKRRENKRKREEFRKKLAEAKKETLKEELMSEYSNENGLAVKKSEKGWYGFVDKNGNWVIKPKFIYAEPFKNGRAYVTSKIGRKYYINSKGKKI